MSEISATVTSSIPALRGPFYTWLVPGVFYDQLETVLPDSLGVAGVSGTSGTTGPWDVPGSHRTVHLSDGNSVREEVTGADTPDYFSYRVTEFTHWLIKRLVKEARGQWWFTDEGAGTHIKWTYTFEAKFALAAVMLVPAVKILWRRAMKAAVRIIKDRAVREVQGAVGPGEWNFDLEKLHGPQEMTDEDRAYSGSRYSEVREALFQNPYRAGRSGEVPGPLPMFRSTIRNAWSGMLPWGRPDRLKQATARSVDSRADLRWGPDGKGFRRILSPNGICVLGTWEITQETDYSGYFANGAKGLFIGRYSSDGNETKRGQRRSLSLAGKIYPTTDPEHPTALVTASFMSQEDLGGMKTPYINDADLRNEPNVSSWRRGIYVLIMARAGLLFVKADKVPDARQLHEIAELGKPDGAPARTPRHMLLKMSEGQSRIEGDHLDFRDEVYAHLFEPGRPEPTGSITFDVSVSDSGKRKGVPGFRRVKVKGWQRVGRLTITEAVASYNGDHVIQFHHPGWRNDANDPSTAIRQGGKRVNK